MSTSTQKLQKAKQLIKEKNYDAAREILAGLDHPSAKELLYEIDESISVESHKLKLPGGTFWWLVAVASTLIPLLVLIAHFVPYVHLHMTGETAEGTITERYSELDIRGWNYVLVYTFEVDGTLYTSKAERLQLWVYDAYSESSPVTIRYDSDNPMSSTIQDSEPPFLWIFAIGGLTFILFLLMRPLFQHIRQSIA